MKSTDLAGRWTLGAAGAAFALYALLRPYTDQATPAGVAGVASGWWVAAHLLAVAALVLLPLGLRAAGLHRAALVTGLGSVLVLPYYGAETFGLQAVAAETLRAGGSAMPAVTDAIRYGAVQSALFAAGLLLLAVGGVVAAVVVRRRGGGAAGVGVGLGLLLFYGPPPVRMAHGLLVLVGSLLLARWGGRGGHGVHDRVPRLGREDQLQRHDQHAVSTDFGTGLAGCSGAPVQIDVSDDRQAFTLTYADFQVEVNNGDGSPGVGSARGEWFVLPVEETPQGDDYAISLGGYAVTADACSATVLLVVNGRESVEHVEPGSDRAFVLTREGVTSGFDRQMSVAVGVLVQGDVAAESAGTVAVSAVDGEIGRRAVVVTPGNDLDGNLATTPAGT